MEDHEFWCNVPRNKPVGCSGCSCIPRWDDFRSTLLRHLFTEILVRCKESLNGERPADEMIKEITNFLRRIGGKTSPHPSEPTNDIILTNEAVYLLDDIERRFGQILIDTASDIVEDNTRLITVEVVSQALSTIDITKLAGEPDGA